MATDAKDIELRVRARDYSQKTLDGVTKALEELTKAQEDQLKGAKQGEVSANALEASYKKIEDAVKALIRQDALTKQFEQQAAALDKAKVAADAARTAQVEFANSLANVETKTKAQIKTQNDLAKAVKNTEAAQVRAQNNYDKSAAKLSELGIAADQVGAAQKQIAQGVALGNAALERQSAALDTVEADMRQAAAATASKAAADKAAAAAEVDAQRSIIDALNAAAAVRAKNNAAAESAAKARQASVKAEQEAVAAMRQAADQAEATAKGYLVMGRAIKSAKVDELGKQLEGIINPIGQANKSLDGLTANLDKLVAAVATINGPVKDFRATMAGLNAAMSATQGIAAQITAYRNQAAVLGQASIAYQKAKADVAALTAQMRAGGGDAAALGAQMNTALGTLKQASAAFQQQAASTKQLGDGLKAAGVDTQNLGAAEAKLVADAQRAAAAMKTLTDAYAKNGAAAETAAKSSFKFFDNTRQTLSYTQRLRGELIGLATAYVGLQAGINLAKESLDAFQTVQKIQSQLLIAAGGDAAKAADDYNYLRAAADRIGISFREAAPAFGKFAIAAKTFGLSGQETRFVFEKLAESSRKAGLSASDFEGVLKAVEQMLSKGTIQAEELRGQLGDRLPGAFAAMAQGMGKTTAELTKMMELGGVGAGEVLNLVRGLDAAYKGADTAALSLNAAQARFANAALDFQKQIADAGLAKAFEELLNKLTSFMASGEGQLLAQQIGAAFTSLIDVLKLCIDNLDTIKVIFSALLGLGVAKWVFGAVAGFVSLAGAIGSMVTVMRTAITAMIAGETAMAAFGAASVATAGGIGILRGALLLLTRSIPLLSALTAGILAAKYAYDKLKSSKDRAALQPGTTLTGNGAQGSWDDSGSKPTEDPKSGPDASTRAAKQQQEELAKNQIKLDKETTAAKKKAAKDELGVRQDLIKEQYDARRDAAKKEVTDAKAQGELLATINKQEQQALQADKIRFDAENAKSGAASAAKEVSLKEQVKNALLKIQDDLANSEAKLDKNSTFDERKKARLDAIAHAYDKIRTQIAKLSTLDKSGADDAKQKLDAYVGQLQALESQKVTQEEVKKLEKELDDQTKLRQAGLDQEKAKYDAGLQSQEEFLANTKAINERGDSAIKQAADNLQTFVDAAVKAQAGILSLTDQAEIKTKTTTATAGASQTNNKVNDAANKAAEESIDRIIAKREAENTLLRQQYEMRTIGQDEYAAKVNANNEQYKAQIVAQTALLIQQLEVQKQIGIQEGTMTVERQAALDAQIAKLQLVNDATKNATAQAGLFQGSLNNAFGGGIDQSLNAVVTSLAAIADGTQTAAQGFQNLGVTVANVIAQMLLDIAKAIAKQLILNALAGVGGPIGTAAKAAGGAVQLHSGGRVSHTSSGVSRRVDPNIFANAPRFHDGGTIPGLRSDEVPAILQTGEQVLSRDDPNNVLNGSRPINMENAPASRFVLVDDRQGVPEAMASAEGESVTMVHLKRNAATIKQLVR